MRSKRLAATYSNENFPLPVVQGLRERGHDVLTIQEPGPAADALSDPDLLAFSKSLNRAALTFSHTGLAPINALGAGLSEHHPVYFGCALDPAAGSVVDHLVYAAKSLDPGFLGG